MPSVRKDSKGVFSLKSEKTLFMHTKSRKLTGRKRLKWYDKTEYKNERGNKNAEENSIFNYCFVYNRQYVYCYG